MLDPACIGKSLFEFVLRLSYAAALLVKQNSA
jgi:hypothetical protein